MARCYRRLCELERGRRDRNGEVKGDLRDYLGKQFQCSGRNLDRWEKALDAPIEVQHAVSAKQLSMGTAEKVATLPKAIQEKIAVEIRAGKDPKKAVAACMPTEVPPRTPQSVYRCLLDSIAQAEQVLPDGLYANLTIYKRDLPTLRKGPAVIKKIVQAIEAACEERNGN